MIAPPAAPMPPPEMARSCGVDPHAARNNMAVIGAHIGLIILDSPC
jgi:hypothetical protein